MMDDTPSRIPRLDFEQLAGKGPFARRPSEAGRSPGALPSPEVLPHRKLVASDSWTFETGRPAGQRQGASMATFLESTPPIYMAGQAHTYTGRDDSGLDG